MHAHAYMSVFASSLSYRGRSAGESVVAAVGDNSDEEPEPRDWDLNILCDALLVKRALVPVSQKSAINFFSSNPTRGIKRRETRIDCNFIPPFLESEYLRREAHTIRSSSLLNIWIRLPESVPAGHAHFPAVRTSHVITHLLSDNDEPEPEPDDTNAATAAEKTSYDVCLANWANDSSNGAAAAVADETDADVTARRQSVFFQLAQALW